MSDTIQEAHAALLEDIDSRPVIDKKGRHFPTGRVLVGVTLFGVVAAGSAVYEARRHIDYRSPSARAVLGHAGVPMAKSSDEIPQGAGYVEKDGQVLKWHCEGLSKVIKLGLESDRDFKDIHVVGDTNTRSTVDPKTIIIPSPEVVIPLNTSGDFDAFKGVLQGTPERKGPCFMPEQPTNTQNNQPVIRENP